MAKFEDGKDPAALRTIGEISAALGVRTHVLRYWEEQFPQLNPLKRAGGRRLYRPEDVALIETIDRLVNREGYTLKGAQAALKGGQAGGSTRLTTPQSSPSTASDLLPRLKAIRAGLAAALAA